MTVRQIAGRHETVVDLLRAVAQSDPELEAYVEVATGDGAVAGSGGADGRCRLTFAQWDEAADAVAWLLADRGVGPGDVVCLLLPSSIDYAVCYQAVARRGAVTSGVNLRLSRPEQESILERLTPTVSVVDPALVELGSLGPAAGRLVDRHELAAAIAAGAPGGWRPASHRAHEDDPVCVVWTSGSTGSPKGALFDHRNLRAVAAGTDVLSQRGDRRLSPLPFAHVGYMTRPWDEIAQRITTVITPQPWTAQVAIDLMASERVTVGQGVPTQWALVLRHPDLETADLSALRIAGAGAARVPAELVRDMRRRLGCPVVVRYTSTETSLGTGTQPEDPDEVACTTVGRPVPGVELAVVGDDGRAVPSGEVGRVRLRSAAVMRGYVGCRLEIDRASTDTVLSPDGWLSTGDLGWIGSDGNLRLAGRLTEMYIRGGYNVYPAEVEAVLRAHPALSEAAVVGTEDPVLGEIGVAFVVTAPAAQPEDGRPSAPSLEVLREWCRTHLADYKAPDRLVVLEALPLNSLGKTDLRALKELAGARIAGGAGGAEPLSGATKGVR